MTAHDEYNYIHHLGVVDWLLIPIAVRSHCEINHENDSDDHDYRDKSNNKFLLHLATTH